MGSGVVKAQQQQPQQQPSSQQPRFYHSNPNSQQRGTGSRQQTNAAIMTCDSCSVNFTLFKRKHQCKECKRYFCSKCMAKEQNRSSSQRRCNACRILGSPESFDKNELMTLKVKDLRQHLIANNVVVSSCTEKNDLVELLLRYHANRQNTEAQARNQQTARVHQQYHTQQSSTAPTDHRAQAPSSTQQDSNVSSTSNTSTQHTQSTETDGDRMDRLRRRQEEEMRRHELRRVDSPEAPPETRPARQRASISDLSHVDDIDSMTIRQLKEILATNFVDFKGCVEKWELVERVKRLFREKEDQRQRADDILKDYGESSPKEETSNSSSGTDTGVYSEMCKICMDSPIDCVLLECGHMITCTKCGKRMSECPVCRQYVVRVVHTFKA